MFVYTEHVRYAVDMASRTATKLVHPDRAELRFTTVMAALSDPVRLAIVARLADLEPGGELPCTTLAVPVSKSTQSGHFKVLREAGVIRQRDEKTWRMNRLRRDDLDARFPGLLDLAVRHGHEVIAGWVRGQDRA
jgi:DNA-binding transcriptional ArsR family regulator